MARRRSPRPPRTPAYRARSGSGQAIVTLTDSATKRRRDYWLGAFGSPGSRELYHRLIAAWEAGGRRLPDPDEFRPSRSARSGGASAGGAVWRRCGVRRPLRG